MKIEHVAIWTRDVNDLANFYVRHFEGEIVESYEVPRTGFESRFLRFGTGSRLELMSMPSIPESQDNVVDQFTGLIHLAFEVGTRDDVDRLTKEIAAEGCDVLGQPRMTGDGYYESVVLDPSGNRVELCAAR